MYRLSCDRRVPSTAGPTEVIGTGMVYTVQWRTPLVCNVTLSPHASACGAPPQPHAPVARPSVQQLDWMDMEVAAMVCFNLQTICADRGPRTTAQKCQSYGYVPTIETTAAWNPSGLDTDEWARVSASFGAKYIILVAGHMSGFTLWDTQVHNFSIAHTQYKGGGQDVVRDLLNSCKKYNLKLGFFYSVHFNWYLGVNNFEVGWPPLGPKNYTQAEYLAIAKVQLEEVISLFGAEGPVEVWFDGKATNWPSFAAILKLASPGIVATCGRQLRLTMRQVALARQQLRLGQPFMQLRRMPSVTLACLISQTLAGFGGWATNKGSCRCRRGARRPTLLVVGPTVVATRTASTSCRPRRTRSCVNIIGSGKTTQSGISNRRSY